jgi:hypothetical protein
MKITKVVWTALLGLCVLITCGDACWPTQPISGGFPVDADFIIVDSAGNPEGGGGVPNSAVSGTWLSDNSGAVGSVKSFSGTTDDDGVYAVADGRVNANWQAQVSFNPGCVGLPQPYTENFPDVTNIGIGFTCIITVDAASANASTHFVLPGAVPSTITSYGDFSTTYGEPGLRVYAGGGAPGLISTVTATSAVPGSSATFPFPTQSNGSPLAEGFYALTNTNVEPGGSLAWVDSSYLAVGGTTTLSSAFGVDAVDYLYNVCNDPVGGGQQCDSSPPTYSAPILTQYYSNQIVSWLGGTIAVGSEPVAVRGYGSFTYRGHLGGTLYYLKTGPANAIVANSGSISVSIVSFSTNTDVTDIAVGAQPMAITLNSTATMAYVASYGNNSLAEINLSTEAVTRTASGLSGALSVAMDPSGSYVWVGGTNYIYEVSLSNFAVVKSVPVSGSVTSLAASDTQNELVYTLVTSCCSASSTYAANELLLSNLSTPGTYAHASAAPYAPYTMNGTLPSAAVLPQATNVVSARFSNGMGASSTPTGFVIYDLVTHQQIMTGTTPTPVRGIASDPDSMFAYFTLPDSNEYISVPLEHTP